MILEDYEALKCRYPSKKCWNQRAVKRNGERHNLCEMHRQKANNNQRRLDKKRKAGHLLKGGAPTAAVALDPRAIERDAGISGAPESDTSEYDYRHHQHHHTHLQQQQLHHQQPHHRHEHPVQQQPQHDHQQYLYHPQHIQQQQEENRLRASLSHIYAAAQSLSPHSPPRHAHHHPYHRHVPAAHVIKRERELTPLRPSSSLLPPAPAVSSSTSSVAARPPMLHLPPLTAHIPSLRSSPLRLATPVMTSSSRSGSPSPSSPAATKPTILLPPITSVPRCHPSGAFPLPRAGGAAPSAAPVLPSWGYHHRSEEKVNSA